jgi:HAMP domain-containing protein
MTLRVRLLLGYAYLVSLLLIAVASSVWGFFQLRRDLDQILRRDFRTVKAATAMAQALERQDSLTLVLLAAPGADPAPLKPFEAAFEQALAEAEGIADDDEEAALLARIRSRYSELRAARESLVVQPAGGGLEGYESRLLPAFSSLLEDILQLLDRRQEAMLQADRRARRTAARSLAGLGFLAAVALLSLSLQARAMRRGLFARLRRLGDAVAAIAGGDRRRRLRTGEGDELAALARQLNRLLDAHDELQGHLAGRLAHHRQLVLGLIRAFGEPAAVVGLDGKVAAHNVAASDLGRLQRLEAWTRGPGRDLLRSTAGPPAEAVALEDGGEIRLELLLAEGCRPVAWLVRFRSGAPPAAAGKDRLGRFAPGES